MENNIAEKKDIEENPKKRVKSHNKNKEGLNKEVFVVMPAYNEEKSIGNVINSLSNEGYCNIIIVDDGSKDNTYKIAEASLKKLTELFPKNSSDALRHIINRGQGAALQTGISYAIERGADIIVTFDADGQHNAKEIKNLVLPVKNKETEVVLGSRFISPENKSNVPALKKLVLKGGIVFTWIFSGKKLTDTHNGFRAISRKAAQSILIKHDGMEHASEIIDEICRKKISFKEVPVTINYSEYSKRKGQSVFNSFKIVFRLLIRRLID